MDKIYVDVGSSSIKAYKTNQEKPELLLTRSLHFKKGFQEDVGFSSNDKKELIETLLSLKEKHPKSKIEVFATSIFRKMNEQVKRTLIDDVFEETGIYFNIVSHELESFYLEISHVDHFTPDRPVLLMSVGGGSTEFVVMYGKEALERYNIDLGVGTILEKFPSVNEDVSGASLTTVTDYVKEILPRVSNEVQEVFYTGGELEYMQRTGYQLEDNSLFQDTDHPSLISANNFSQKNQEVFSHMKLDELEKLMPEDPKWMHGARACSAIAQAVTEKYSIETVIPSNNDLVHGVKKQEFRKVTLRGSFRKHLPYISNVKKRLEDQGVTVLSPEFTTPKNPESEFVVFEGEEGKSPLALERKHLQAIENSDALIVCDPEGYVGASALIEIGYAQKMLKRIIFVDEPEEFMLKTLPGEIGL